MESSGITSLVRWPKVVRWAISVGLALLFLVVLLYGLREATLVRADPGILYVDGASGSDTTDCTDPASPCATIGYALDQAGDGDTILVAQGIYTESLLITKTVTLEGAYDSNGWSRCLGSYTTAIHGDQDESVAVIDIQSTLSETTVIDGFTIANGYRGIQIGLSAVAVQNSRIVQNQGRLGTGMRIDRSRVFITNTLIADNEATIDSGALSIVSTGPPLSRVEIYNSTIANNHTDGFCNGIFCSNSWCGVFNSIVWGHEGEDLFGVGATYSDIEMGHPGEGNISEDPLFVDPANGEYHLQSDSPCIDAGSSEYAPSRDFEGDPRPIGEGVDMGFDEFLQVYYLPIIFNHFDK